MADLRLKELPEEERPREKLMSQGASALSNSELLAILLGTGSKGLNVLSTAREILKRAGTLADLERLPPSELTRVRGVGKAKAVQLAAAFQLGARLGREMATQQVLDSPEQVYQLLGGEMRSLTQESLRVVLLNTKYRLIRVEQVTTGTVNESLAHPREVLRPAITHSAFAFILVHNHPSGDPSPSRADCKSTSSLAEAARLMQIEFLDHVIIGIRSETHDAYFSFREQGLL